MHSFLHKLLKEIINIDVVSTTQWKTSSVTTWIAPLRALPVLQALEVQRHVQGAVFEEPLDYQVEVCASRVLVVFFDGEHQINSRVNPLPVPELQQIIIDHHPEVFLVIALWIFDQVPIKKQRTLPFIILVINQSQLCIFRRCIWLMPLPIELIIRFLQVLKVPIIAARMVHRAHILHMLPQMLFRIRFQVHYDVLLRGICFLPEP